MKARTGSLAAHGSMPSPGENRGSPATLATNNNNNNNNNDLEKDMSTPTCSSDDITSAMCVDRTTNESPIVSPSHSSGDAKSRQTTTTATSLSSDAGVSRLQKIKSPLCTSSAPPRSANNEDDELEEQHFRRIVNAFRYYRTHSMQKLNKTEAYLKTLPKQHQIYLSKYAHHLDSVRVAIEHNYEIIKLILVDVSQMFDNVEHTVNIAANSANGVTLMDIEKVQSTLKQFVRDWSEEGADERKTCYQPILDKIERLFPPSSCDVKSVTVLVPGAGLGRLAHEIAKRGYTCQGNEFSLFMLIASNFVLNKCRALNMFRLYPWVHQYSNNIQSQDQVRYILFPDVNPSDLVANVQFSMAAGDFLQVYTENDEWDCVATCFFLDTAKNVIDYIETIFKILKPGGYWINLGPLLYHFADVANEDSIEPSMEDILSIVKKCGFILDGDVYNVPTTYAQNPYSMLRYEYNSIFFVCRKPLSNATQR